MQMASSVLMSLSNIAKHYKQLSTALLCRKKREINTQTQHTDQDVQWNTHGKTEQEGQPRHTQTALHRQNYTVHNSWGGRVRHTVTERWDRQSEPTSQWQTVTKWVRHTKLQQSYEQIHSLGSLETGLSSMTLSMRTIILRSNKIWPLNMADTVIKDNLQSFLYHRFYSEENSNRIWTLKQIQQTSAKSLSMLLTINVTNSTIWWANSFQTALCLSSWSMMLGLLHH